MCEALELPYFVVQEMEILLYLTSRLREVGFLRVERSDLQKFNLDGEVCKTS